jgi:hypothetical protein
MKSVLVRTARRGCLVAALVIGIAAWCRRRSGRPLLLPAALRPVICDHGKTYPNIYCARCKNATNCVPTGDL